MIQDKKERWVHIYRVMMRIRKFEELTEVYFNQGRFRGTVHPYIGQEAIGSTIICNLDDGDYVGSTHRGHGHTIAMGCETKRMLAEMLGRENGLCRGRGGSMHMQDFSRGYIGQNGIVAGGVAMTTGAALAAQIKGTRQAAVAFYGEGGSNQGVVHETMNMASIWKLPMIFVCENNQFGVTTRVETSTSVKDISIRATGYDMPGITVDGRSVQDVERVIRDALDRARSGEGPTLIEAKCYRWLGHYFGDSEPTRTREEIEAEKKKDPIQIHRAVLVSEKFATEAELDSIDREVQEEIDQAKIFADAGPAPDPRTVTDAIFCEPVNI